MASERNRDYVIVVEQRFVVAAANEADARIAVLNRKVLARETNFVSVKEV